MLSVVRMEAQMKRGENDDAGVLVICCGKYVKIHTTSRFAQRVVMYYEENQDSQIVRATSRTSVLLGEES